MIRPHIPLPGPFVWIPERRRRRPSGRHTMALLAIVGCLCLVIHVLIWVLLGIALITTLVIFIHTLRERRNNVR